MKITTQIIDNQQYIKLNYEDKEFEQIVKTHLILKIKNHRLYKNIITYDALYFMVKSDNDIKELQQFLSSLNLIKQNDFANIKFNEIVLDIKDDFAHVKDSSEYRYFSYVVENNILREPKEYQMQGAYLNIQKERLLNFSTPGSGKTMMCNMTYAFLKNEKKVNKLIVICPKNAFNTWQHELYSDLLIDDVCILDAKTKNTDLNKEVFLVNYEKVQNEYILALISMLIDENSYVVFDELHRLKNPTGVRSTKFIDLLKNIKYATMLSGSPIPNGLIDLYYPLNILFNGSALTFKKEEFNILSDLKFKLYPHYFRVCKNQLQIPIPKKDKLYYYKVSKFEQDIISDIAKKKFFFIYKYIIIQKLLITPDYLLDVEFYDKYRRVPLIYGQEELDYINQKVSNNKFNKLTEIIDDLLTHKKPMIVWCTFIKTIDKVYNYYKAQNIDVEIIYGATKAEQRTNIINRFNDGKIKILITNYATMAESVSLHHSCHDAIFFEYSFNLVHYMQAKDRIHRVGVTDYTQYHYVLPYENTNMFMNIDNYILEKLLEKEQLMNRFLDTNIFSVEAENNLLHEIEEEVYGINKLDSSSYTIYQKFKMLENKYLIIPTNSLVTKLKVSQIELARLLNEINFEYSSENNLFYDGGYDSIHQLLKEHSVKNIIKLDHIIPKGGDNDFRALIATYNDIFYIDQHHLCLISEFDAVEFNIIKGAIDDINLDNHLDFCENYPEIIKLLV